MATEPAEVLRLDGVAVRRSGRTMLGPLDWTVLARGTANGRAALRGRRL